MHRDKASLSCNEGVAYRDNPDRTNQAKGAAEAPTSTVLIAVALCVRYWRIAIPLILIAALTLTILGLIEGLTAFYRLIG